MPGFLNQFKECIFKLASNIDSQALCSCHVWLRLVCDVSVDVAKFRVVILCLFTFYASTL